MGPFTRSLCGRPGGLAQAKAVAVLARPEPAPPSYRQPALFEASRTLPEGTGVRDVARRADPYLAAWADQFTRRHAARCGWSRRMVWRTRTAVNAAVSLLQVPGAFLTPGDLTFLAAANSYVQPTATAHLSVILTTAGLLEGDRLPAAITWAHEQIAPLPTPMADEVRAWLTTMHQGRSSPPRRMPRSAITIRLQLRWSLPALTQWAAEGRTSLREVTPRDVRAALPPPGTARARMGQGLRSLFGVLKDQQMVFTDPTFRIQTGAQAVPTIPVPLDVARIRDALHSADPAGAALCALISFHALTVHQLQHLKLTDLTGDGHLTTVGSRIPLAALARDLLDVYLAHRRRRWPHTANPYLFINRNTAITTTAKVNNRWIDIHLGPHLTASALRHDRLLDEAHAADGDPKILTVLFGLGLNSALRYTRTVTHPSLDVVRPGGEP